MEDRNDGADAPSDEGALRRARALGSAIRESRGSRSQVELASSLGVTQSTISAWESGERVPTLEQLRLLDDALERPLGYLAQRAGFAEVSFAPLPTLISTHIVDADEVVEMLEAAMRLGFGVRLTNESEADDDDPTLTREVWILEIAGEPLMATAD